MQKQIIKIATIDLYNNERNEGMRCIGEIVEDTKKKFNDLDISYNIFETRFKEDIPGIDSDIFISSGGPGSPFEGKGKKWEKDYFNLIEKIYSHNQSNTDKKKYIFFICHSVTEVVYLYHDMDRLKHSSICVQNNSVLKKECKEFDEDILNQCFLCSSTVLRLALEVKLSFPDFLLSLFWLFFIHMLFIAYTFLLTLNCRHMLYV